MQPFMHMDAHPVQPRRGVESPRSKMLHKISPANRLRTSLCAACLGLILLGSGCGAPPNDEMTKGVVSGERPVAMEGGDAFFSGAVTAKITVSRGVGPGLKSGKGRGDSGDKTTYRDYEYSEGKQTLGSPLPPVTLHLILGNPGAEPIAVTMIDFNSDLGNFVIDPATITIPPGTTAEPTPMVSQLGVSSDELPFTVRLQLGKAKETRTILVKNVLDDSGNPKPAAK
jgi:hypothetical protein